MSAFSFFVGVLSVTQYIPNKPTQLVNQACPEWDSFSCCHDDGARGAVVLRTGKNLSTEENNCFGVAPLKVGVGHVGKGFPEKKRWKMVHTSISEAPLTVAPPVSAAVFQPN